MALDVGTKRIGIALSDYLHVIATPHTTIPRTPEQDAIESILKIAKENNVKTIIVGLPINMDGTKGFQAQDCIDFSQKICGFDIMYEDERLTSVISNQILIQADLSRKKRKKKVDGLAAQIILQSYLDRKGGIKK